MSELVIREAVDVAATAARVWEVIVDLRAWPSWNTVTAEGALEVGGRLWIGVRVRARRVRIPSRVVVFEPGRELTWAGGVLGVLWAVHGLRVDEVGPGACRLVHHETFTGAAVRWLPKLMGRTPGASHRRVAERVGVIAEGRG